MELIKKWFTPKNIIKNVAELIIIGIAILTFSGEEFIGRNLPSWILLTAIALFLIYPIYKGVVKVFDFFGKNKERK